MDEKKFVICINTTIVLLKMIILEIRLPYQVGVFCVCGKRRGVPDTMGVREGSSKRIVIRGGGGGHEKIE